MKLSRIEKAIRYEFPGPNNKGLRAELRRCEYPEQVRLLAHSTGFTACGLASLEAVAEAFEV